MPRNTATIAGQRWPFALAAGVALVFAFGSAPGAASVGTGVRATFDGRAIALSEVASHHCHDASYPLIRCFASAAERDLDLASHMSADGLGVTIDSVAATNYVTWFDLINYGGSSFTASISYADLSTISWDNKISSFKSLNGGRPKWWQSTNFTGTSWRWLAGAQVADVGAGATDQFSSVANVP